MNTLEKKLENHLEVDNNPHTVHPQVQQPIQKSSISPTFFSGPLPPPEILTQYDQILPGIANRFLQEPHIEAEHRRALLKYSVEQQVSIKKRGQNLAFSLAVFCLLGAFTCIIFGYNIAAFTTLLLPLGTFVSMFIQSKIQKEDLK